MKSLIIASNLSLPARDWLCSLFYSRLGVREFIMPNIEIEKLGEHALLDLDVSI